MNGIQDVTDVSSHGPLQIENAADVLRPSKKRMAVFRAIYAGKRQPKSAKEIQNSTGIKHIQHVLNEIQHLAAKGLIRRERENNQTVCYKVPHIALKKDRILDLAVNPGKLKKVKAENRGTTTSTVVIRVPASVRIKQITVDDISSFKSVRSVIPNNAKLNMRERIFNNGVRKILGGKWEQKDWGGESDDLYTTQLQLGGKRIPTAFAFKGRATKSPLVPKKMGKNGDQIYRLFESPATLFAVQFQGLIAESVIKEMQAYASLKSYHTGQTIYYMAIDGQDSVRLVEAYKNKFK